MSIQATSAPVLNRDEFDAGSAFDDFDALASAMSGPAPEPEAAPAEPVPADGDASNTESSDADAAPETDAADPSPEAAAAAKAAAGARPVAKAPATPAGQMAVKHGGKSVAFKLDPKDKQLQETLALGLGARTWQAERDTARKEVTTVKAELETERKKTTTWDTLDELAQLGHPDLVASALLGDKNMAALKATILREAEIESHGTDSERRALAAARQTRDRAVKDHFSKKELKAREASLTAREEEIEASRMHDLAVVASRRYNFSKLIDDPDVAEAYNQDVWALAWSDLQQVAATKGAYPSASEITSAFERRYKRTSAAIQRKVETRVTQTLESKTKEARKQAAVVATARHPGARAVGTSVSDVTGAWDGRSVGDLFDALRKR